MAATLRRSVRHLATCVAIVWAAHASGAELEPCRLKGVPHEAQCGHVRRPLDPARPDGPTIDVHFAVLPALARNKRPDPVFFFAGGPGQSAIALAGPVAAQLGRFGNRRDLVFIDQRGTGRSAPLSCDEPADARRPLAELLDPAQQLARLSACRERLMQLPHGDLRHYTTTIAMGDVEAVRQALGVGAVNLIGASYGTRAALEYLRLHPQAVRRVVLDGAAPPDMVLPQSFSTDNQAALDAMFDACAAEPACRESHPQLPAQWRALLRALPREVVVAHPLLGRDEHLRLTVDMVLAMVRSTLYVPTLAAALPQAIADAGAGRLAPLFGLASALGGGRSDARLYTGMHFSVVCAEDLPRRAASADAPGADFGTAFGDWYARACAEWPRGPVDPAFYTVPPARVPVLVLSGGADPATPPRHGARVAAALGPAARHEVVPHAGHGVMNLPCLRELVFKFIDAATDDAARALDFGCAAGMPRATAFVPLSRASGSRP
ncbi:MAG: alpha/beta hydrolase [Burkholderiaceae bacterium]